MRNCAFVLLFALAFGALPVFGQTTVFTYQGKLSDGGSAANGQYDLQFNLYDQPAGVNPPLNAAPVEIGDVPVTNGVFTVKLDFGGAFAAGADRFLEIGVRPGASTGVYTVLNPRQQITASPYSIRTLSAAQADNADRLGNLPASDYLRTNGDGANVTNLNGANITDSSITGAKIANGEVVRSVNGVKDNLTIAAGTNVTITSNGQIVTVDSNVPVGERNIYGDGSAGNFTLFSTSPPRNLAIGYGSLVNGANLQFNNVQIDGTLIVPSGFVLRATGNVTVGPLGIIAVNPVSNAIPSEYPPQGYSVRGAVRYYGGRGTDLGQVPFLASVPVTGGGNGARTVDNTVNAFGGEGGGSLAIYAKGSITINGNIDVAGRNAQLTGGTGLPGGGGGGGGLFVAVSRGAFTLGTNGFIRAGGGSGANGIAGATGLVYGGGGGGGGGVVLLISTANPSIVNTANVIVTGGNAGNAGVNGTATTLAAIGGGGGAGGGDGGDGTRSASPSGAAEQGNNGDFLAIVAANPENLVH
jgi:hypothetical protein